MLLDGTWRAARIYSFILTVITWVRMIEPFLSSSRSMYTVHRRIQRLPLWYVWNLSTDGSFAVHNSYAARLFSSVRFAADLLLLMLLIKVWTRRLRCGSCLFGLICLVFLGNVPGLHYPTFLSQNERWGVWNDKNDRCTFSIPSPSAFWSRSRFHVVNIKRFTNFEVGLKSRLLYICRYSIIEFWRDMICC